MLALRVLDCKMNQISFGTFLYCNILGLAFYSRMALQISVFILSCSVQGWLTMDPSRIHKYPTVTTLSLWNVF
jgi:hypothetical protein